MRGWLVTIAHNKAIDQIRAAQPPPASHRPAPGAMRTDDEHTDADGELRAALDALPTKQRGAVIYRYLADLPYAEVGALLDSSESAARRSAADGIAKLRATYVKGTAMSTDTPDDQPR